MKLSFQTRQQGDHQDGDAAHTGPFGPHSGEDNSVLSIPSYYSIRLT